MPPYPSLNAAENAVTHIVLWLRLIVEVTGAARLRFARYLAPGLELQLGADILSTAIAPSWDQIGKLGAIAVIRTFLNYFLKKELSERTPAHVEVE